MSSLNGWSSRESFKIMEDFVETIGDWRLRGRLSEVLSERKPFKNFKWHIDNSGTYRQKWFDFKNTRVCEWVAEQINGIL